MFPINALLRSNDCLHIGSEKDGNGDDPTDEAHVLGLLIGHVLINIGRGRGYFNSRRDISIELPASIGRAISYKFLNYAQ